MEGINYSELVQTVLKRHTANHLSEDTEKELIFDKREQSLSFSSFRLGKPREGLWLCSSCRYQRWKNLDSARFN